MRTIKSVLHQLVKNMIQTNPVTLLQGQRKVDHLEEEDLKDAIGYIGQGSWSGVSYQLRAFACVAQWPYSIRVLCKMALEHHQHGSE